MRLTEFTSSPVQEEAGTSYAEQLAKQVFDANPNITDENAILDAAWPLAVKDLGQKRAMSVFNYDEDFPSDLVSVYSLFQKDQQSVAEVRGDNDRHINDPLDGENIFSVDKPLVAKRALSRLKALLTVRLFAEDELRMMHLYDVVQDKQLFDIIKYAKRHAPPKTDLRNYEPFSSRIQTLIARAEKKLNLNQSQEQGVAEGNYDDNRTGFSRGPRDDERHDLDSPRPTIYALKINGKIWQKDGNTVTFFTKERALAARNSILNKRPELEIGLVQRQD